MNFILCYYFFFTKCIYWNKKAQFIRIILPTCPIYKNFYFFWCFLRATIVVYILYTLYEFSHRRGQQNEKVEATE